jgi:hypothetical protein
MTKPIRLLAPAAAIALMSMGTMTMPIASSATCDDGQFWSPHANACEPLPCPSGSSFVAAADVCQCHPGSRFNPLRNICESLDLYAPPFLGH